MVMYGCERWTVKEGWVPKNWCFQTVVLEKTLENPLDCKEIKPVSPQLNQSWIFIRRTDAEVEASILWPSDAKSQLTGKTKQNKKNPWYWESLRAGGEGGSGGRDGWIASLTQWTWVWGNSGRQWRTEKPDVFQSTGSQSQAWLSNWTTVVPMTYDKKMWDPTESGKAIIDSIVDMMSTQNSKKQHLNQRTELSPHINWILFHCLLLSHV